MCIVFVACVWGCVSRLSMPVLAVDGIVPAGSAFVPLSCLPLFVLRGPLSRCCRSVLFLVLLLSRFLVFVVCLFALVAWVLVVWPTLSCFPPSPPRVLVCWFFSGPVSVLLVPPSGYLVVSTTVRLSYLWHGVSGLIGSCLHCASWQQRLRPCVGLCPLHHGVGVVHVPFAPALRYSPLGDPDFPSDIAKVAHACLLGLCGLLPPSPAAFPGVRSLLVCWLSLAFSPLRVWLVRPVRLFVRGPGWCWWLPLLCGFGLLCWRGRFCLFGLAVVFFCLFVLSVSGWSFGSFCASVVSSLVFLVWSLCLSCSHLCN